MVYGEAEVNRVPASVLVRAVLYGAILVWLAGDLYLWHGPLRRVLDPLCSRCRQTTGPQGVVARGKGFTITLGEVDAEVAARWVRGGAELAAVPRSGDALRNLRRAALDDLVADACIDRKSPDARPDRAAIAKAMADAGERFGGSEALGAILASADMTPDQFGEALAREAMRGQWWEERMCDDKADVVPEAEVLAWWQAHGATMQWPRRVKARHLFKASLHRDPAAVKESMDSLHARLTADPAQFGALVAAESDDESTKRTGGDLGWVEESPSRLPAGLDFSLLASATPGKVLPPMRSALGWHIFVIDATEPARPATLAEMRPQVLARLATGRRDAAIARIRATLRAEASVEQTDALLDQPITIPIPAP